MLTKIIAWVGLVTVLAISLHWLLTAAQRRGRRLPAWLGRLLAQVGSLGRLWDADHRADRRRQQRVERARLQREAIARASSPMPLDPPVTWEGNVARPQFGAKAKQHTLH